MVSVAVCPETMVQIKYSSQKPTTRKQAPRRRKPTTAPRTQEQAGKFRDSYAESKAEKHPENWCASSSCIRLNPSSSSLVSLCVILTLFHVDLVEISREGTGRTVWRTEDDTGLFTSNITRTTDSSPPRDTCHCIFAPYRCCSQSSK